MTENTKKFLEAVSGNDELTAKIGTMTQAELIALAEELGLELTDDDFVAPAGEVTDDELDAVAGGGDCYCVAGGGGTKDGANGVCACVAYGAGNYKEETNVVRQRCECAFVGTGGNV